MLGEVCEGDSTTVRFGQQRIRPHVGSTRVLPLDHTATWPAVYEANQPYLGNLRLKIHDIFRSCGSTVSSSLPRSIVAAPITSETTLKFHFTKTRPVTILKHWFWRFYRLYKDKTAERTGRMSELTVLDVAFKLQTRTTHYQCDPIETFLC